ncbi:MAG: recombination mediator RecR [Parcubacteria group bacterium]
MSDKFKELIDFFTKLPGIGPRQATRLVLAMLNWQNNDLHDFSKSIKGLKVGRIFCDQCHNLSDADLCEICSNPKRNQARLAVVERITDLASMEKTGAFDGTYHVLGGSINPVNNVLPEKLKIKELTTRVKTLKAEYGKDLEIILATSHNTHGDTTALYLEEELKPLKVNVTRLARGMAAGSTLEYTDETTLAHALKERR